MRRIRKCSDCGQEVGEAGTFRERRDICAQCGENREWLLDNVRLIGLAKFQEVQRSMASHRGTAKRKIDKLKLELS